MSNLGDDPRPFSIDVAFSDELESFDLRTRYFLCRLGGERRLATVARARSHGVRANGRPGADSAAARACTTLETRVVSGWQQRRLEFAGDQ